MRNAWRHCILRTGIFVSKSKSLYKCEIKICSTGKQQYFVKIKEMLLKTGVGTTAQKLVNFSKSFSEGQVIFSFSSRDRGLAILPQTANVAVCS